MELEARETTGPPEDVIRPVAVLARDAMLVHELAQQCGMVLLLVDEQLDDLGQRPGAVRSLVALGGAQQGAALGLFAELEGGDGIRDHAPLVCGEPLTVALGQGRALPGVIEKVIEPDLEIGLHRQSPHGVPA